MSTVMPVTCAECTLDVRVPTTSITLVKSGEVTTYGFCCPRCRAETVRVPPDGLLRELQAAGVRLRVYVPPARADGPPLTEDDLIAFGRFLESAPSAVPGQP